MLSASVKYAVKERAEGFSIISVISVIIISVLHMVILNLLTNNLINVITILLLLLIININIIIDIRLPDREGREPQLRRGSAGPEPRPQRGGRRRRLGYVHDGLRAPTLRCCWRLS